MRVSFIFYLLIVSSLFPTTSYSNYFIKPPVSVSQLQPKNNQKNFSFFIAGHAYGLQDGDSYPSPSLINYVDSINNLEFDFGIFLGDHIHETSLEHLNSFNKSIAQKLNFPLFNAVGNHEAYKWDKYVKYFGKTFFSFIYKTTSFVFLDTEIPYDSVIQQQKMFIDSTFQHIFKNDTIQNVFICTHRLAWLNNIPEFSKRKNIPGLHYHKVECLDFNSINHSLSKIAATKKVYWLSGDNYLPLLHHFDSLTNVTYVSSTIGLQDDNIIKIDISNKGDVQFNPLSLTQKSLLNLERYTLGYWEPSWKLLSKIYIIYYYDKVKRNYVGAILISIGLFLVLYLIKRSLNIKFNKFI